MIIVRHCVWNKISTFFAVLVVYDNPVIKKRLNLDSTVDKSVGEERTWACFGLQNKAEK